MAKGTTQYTCQACGATSVKWLGRCTSCGGWNTLVEERVSAAAGGRRAVVAGDGPVPVSEIPADKAMRVWVDTDHATTIPLGVPDTSPGFIKSIMGTLITIVVYSLLH